jgi:hypothetical protein
MMNFLKGKNKKVESAPAQPRTIAEIQKEYNHVALNAGQAQYQVFVHTKDLENHNKRLLELNREAAARQQLDKQAAAAAPAPEAPKAEETETK